jgi:hypothetical protein
VSAKPRGLNRLLIGYVVCACVVLISAGCGGSPSADQALNARLTETNSARLQIAKFAGTVTIDHAPPALKPDENLMILLYDPKNPPPANQLPLSAPVTRDGRFNFSTYTHGDGVQTGSYKVLFVAFRVNPLGGRSKSADLLKNLYNDPDTTPFSAEITAPGNADWSFDLEMAGKEANTNPGPHAVTHLVKN